MEFGRLVRRTIKVSTTFASLSPSDGTQMTRIERMAADRLTGRGRPARKARHAKHPGCSKAAGVLADCAQ